jgi:endonuclease/exonuclease/phosphatase family metal-dependent hydrolase
VTQPSPWGTTFRKPKAADPELLRKRFVRWTLAVSVLNVLATILLVAVTLSVSEDWWLTGSLIYIPQTPLLIPSTCLLGCSFVWHMKSAILNMTSIGLLTISMCGFGLSMKPLAKLEESDRNITVVTCNVQNFKPHFSKVMRELSRVKPDIVALQEALDQPPQMLTEYFKDWSFQHKDEFWVGSRWPVTLVDSFEATPYERATALKVRIDTPNGPILLSNVHLMTARRGLSGMSVSSIISGEGPGEAEHHALLRFEEARQTREFISNSPRMPHIIVGDFNMPQTSSVLHENFGDFTNAFEKAGLGFGYTAPCRPVRFWLPNTPWLRIDHVYSTEHFEPMRCRVGEFNGSDHRLVSAVLQLRPTNQPPP